MPQGVAASSSRRIALTQQQLIIGLFLGVFGDINDMNFEALDRVCHSDTALEMTGERGVKLGHFFQLLKRPPMPFTTTEIGNIYLSPRGESEEGREVCAHPGSARYVSG